MTPMTPMTQMAQTVALEVEGEFGAAVARQVRRLVAAAGGGGMRVVFGAVGHVPRLAVAMEHPVIRVGPLLVPGRSPCSTCMAIRLRQHGSDVDVAIAESLRADPSLAVRGSAPHQAMIAAGLALTLARDGVPGATAVLDSRSEEVVRWRLVAADGCPGCGEGEA